MEKKFILLADDDEDDRLLFANAIMDTVVSTNFKTVNDGKYLMDYLRSGEPLPDIIFLDINMPRKNGTTCLAEIKANDKLKAIPVVIISTSPDPSLIALVYKHGAAYFIPKQTSFSGLKFLVNKAITLLANNNFTETPMQNFILKNENASS
jgi:DNA-binding NtrC family response regulator